MTQSRPYPPATTIHADHAAKTDAITRIKAAYRNYFQKWYGTSRSKEQREYLFTHVHAVRHDDTTFGKTFHYFYDTDTTMRGPYPDMEATYAGWLLYMEAMHGN